MPITQNRMLAMIDGWQSHIAILQDLKKDTEYFYQEALRSGNWEMYAHEMHTRLRKATTILPHMDTFTAEKVHFKNNATRNNYMQRRQAKKRGLPGMGERYAADSIIPNQDFGSRVPQPVQFQKSEMSEAANSSDVDFVNALIKSIEPPSPDKMAEALKDAKDSGDVF